MNYESKDGILFTKDFEIPICFPSEHHFSTYSIPTSVTSIGQFAFSECSGLQSIDVESNNMNYESKDGILFTKNLEIPICFPAKHPFSTYTIPTSVTSIGDSAFSYCKNLQSITIPTSVASIGNSAFSDCSRLQLIVVESTNMNYESKDGILFTKSLDTLACFPRCHRLSTYSIPMSVSSIGNSAFSHCSNLQSITISISVTSIGSFAFCNCSSLHIIFLSHFF